VTVPEGTHRVSLYFFNKDGHSGANRFRDYVIELKKRQASRNLTDAAPAMATARVRDFWGGVYQNFVLQGPGDFDFIIRRNGSHVTILSGVFISTQGTAPGHKEFQPPQNASAGEVPSPAALSLWRHAEEALHKTGGAAWDYPARLLAYRALRDSSNTPYARNLLTSWRWELPLWTEEDRSDFAAAMLRTAQTLPPPRKAQD
jgi:hypothetical protein